MRRPGVMAALTVLMAGGLVAAAEQTISYQSGGETISGFLATPEGKEPFPAMVVVQEWWGLNDWVKDQARALAREGYVALAPDLYRGKDKEGKAHQLIMGMPRDRACRDVQATYAYLQGQPDVRKSRRGHLLRRAADRRGRARADQGAGARELRRRRQGTFARAGEGVRGGHEKAGKTVDVKIYPGAGHAFANVNNPWKGYKEDAARDAGKRTVAFLARHLKSD